MNYNVVRNLTAPASPWQDEITIIPTGALPFILGALEKYVDKFVWATGDDWRNGRRLIRQLQVGALMGIGKELLESNRQIYRLLDTALNGITYEFAGTDPVTQDVIITPAIPPAPVSDSPSTLPTGALRNRIGRLLDVVDNALNGTAISDSPSTMPALRDNLEALRLLIENQGTNGEDVERILGEILVALA